tara:strand:+ start:174 stop:806 length:633 start_codon:yes stop_codon:yes gene_type:complete
MPVSINGNTGVITGLAVGGLPDGIIQTADLADDAVTIAKLSTTGTASGSTFLRGDGAFAEAGGGKLLQAVTASSTSATFVYGTTFADSGLSATITPSATGSKVLVFVTQHFIIRRSSSAFGGSITLYRGSTKLTNDINGSDPYKIHLNITGASYVEQQNDFNVTYLDSPNTTSATTYKTMIGAAYGNNGALTGVSNDGTASYMTLLEIGA